MTDGGDGRAGRTWKDRIRAVRRTIELGRPDFVGLQEVLSNQMDDLDHQSDEQWTYETFRGVGRMGKHAEPSLHDENEFVPVLYDKSRWTFVKGGTFWLSRTSSKEASMNWESALPRCATYSTFVSRTDGTKVAVINTHFDHTSETARANSAALLRREADTIARDCKCIVFLMGDFNAPKSERWHRLLTLGNASADMYDVDSVRRDDLDRKEPFVDAWGAAISKRCGACGQSTYHGWRGSYVSNHLWLAVSSRDEHLNVALSGERHVDAILFRQPNDASAKRDVVVTKAKMLTDDKRIRYLGGPHASDHYPVVVTIKLGGRQQPAYDRGGEL